VQLPLVLPPVNPLRALQQLPLDSEPVKPVKVLRQLPLVMTLVP
jgi:hypothetical protein